MFFWNTRNKQAEVQQFLARLADQAAMDRIRPFEEHRGEQRTTLSLGVWVVPMDWAAPKISDAFVALAMDVSSKGLAVIANRSISTSEVLICFPGRFEANFVRAHVLNCKELGLGWLRMGMEATEVVEKEHYPHLRKLNRSMIS